MKKRRHKRVKMVLPVRVWAKDITGQSIQELAHTLDITQGGARLGAIHYQLKIGEALLVQYRHLRMQFRIAWIKPMEGTREYQVGLEAIGKNGENWGLELQDNANNENQLRAMVSAASVETRASSSL